MSCSLREQAAHAAVSYYPVGLWRGNVRARSTATDHPRPNHGPTQSPRFHPPRRRPGPLGLGHRRSPGGLRCRNHHPDLSTAGLDRAVDGGVSERRDRSLAASDCGRAAASAAPDRERRPPRAQRPPRLARAATPRAGGNAGGVAVASPPASPGKRGGGGTLKILYWQAPTILNTHLAQGTKDQDASRLGLRAAGDDRWRWQVHPDPRLGDPLAGEWRPLGRRKVVTWKLKAGVKWSDGTALHREGCRLHLPVRHR